MMPALPVAFITASTLEWLSFLHFTAFALVAVHCLTNRREATSSLLWMFVSWGFPIVGPSLFLLFGINRVPAKAWRKRHSDVRFLNERKAREEEAKPLAYWRSLRKAVATDPEEPSLHKLNHLMNAIMPEFPLLGQNHIEPLVTGDEAFPRMLTAIRAASHHIHMQVFILGNDAIGRTFLEALREKAEQGVTVRLLYDRLGCTHARWAGLFHRYAKIPNMHIACWTQLDPIKGRFQANLHNHRKILVVDGQTAFAGGINLSANNITTPRAQPDRDFHFALLGPIVHELQYSFLCDWYFMTDDAPGALLCEAHFPKTVQAGTALMRMANGAPIPDLDDLTDAFFATVTTAQKQLLAVTPYFVPPPEILSAFRSAALRGVDVRLIVPQKNNHHYAGLAGRALYEDLLKAGVRVFERPPPFIHAKAMLVDDSLALVGTANLDVRSLRLNYETNLAVFDAPFVAKMNQLLQAELACCHEIKLPAWNRRSTARKLAENFCSLLTPVL